MDHNYSSSELGSGYALLSILLWGFTHLDFSDFVKDLASVLALLSGAASLFISYPKIVNRVRAIRDRLKSKKSEP